MRKNLLFLVGMTVSFLTWIACSHSTQNSNSMENKEYSRGSFGYDLNFLQKKQPNLLLLTDSANNAMIALCPNYQGRVMTSSANGMDGHSNGWINYKLIESGDPTPHINAFGGEERLWLGPEGGQFSIYFAPGVKQEFSNWQVPALLDTLPFTIEKANNHEASFSAKFELKNFSGNLFQGVLKREVALLTQKEIEEIVGLKLSQPLKMVAYQSKNSITNLGTKAWTKETGMLSIWMLSMLNPSPDATIFIPYHSGSEEQLGKVVNDDYFGKVSADRLKIDDNFIYLKADGNYRSKIGLSPQRATEWAGSYDSRRKAITLLHCILPKGNASYVNSKWKIQQDPFSGDVINAYNDGPVEDGSQMGPFYELESSSPAANLQPNETLFHTQQIFHLEGTEDQLDAIVRKIFGTGIRQISNKF